MGSSPDGAAIGGRPFFVTRRERRLWIWTALVIVAIYSTLGLARTIADELNRRDLADATFGWGFLLILAAIVVLGLGPRPRGIEIGVALGVVAVYILVLARMAIPEERTHLVEYGVVAVFIHEALAERRRDRAGMLLPFVVAFGLTVVIGTVDELIQLVVPGRVFDVRDITTNAIAALMALVAKLAVIRARNARGPRSLSPRLGRDDRRS